MQDRRIPLAVTGGQRVGQLPVLGQALHQLFGSHPDQLVA